MKPTWCKRLYAYGLGVTSVPSNMVTHEGSLTYEDSPIPLTWGLTYAKVSATHLRAR